MQAVPTESSELQTSEASIDDSPQAILQVLMHPNDLLSWSMRPFCLQLVAPIPISRRSRLVAQGRCLDAGAAVFYWSAYDSADGVFEAT